MKNTIFILIYSFLSFIPNWGCAQRVIKDSIPCEKFGTLYEIKFRDKVCYLPDSLGGESINGRIAVKVFFDDSSRVQNFAIISIRLYKQDSIIYNFYQYSTNPVNKMDYNKNVLKYYDFINDYLIYRAYFIKNDLPLYCDKSIAITYFLPIGNK